MRKLLPCPLAVALLFGGLGFRAAQADGPNEFPLTRRTFLLGLGFHPRHKKGETPQDLQKALGEALHHGGPHRHASA